MSRSMKFGLFKTISIKYTTSFSYRDFRNELQSSRPFKRHITLAGWVFLYRVSEKWAKKFGKEKITLFNPDQVSILPYRIVR